MRIVYCGSGAFGVPSLKWLIEQGYEVPLVVTQPARPAGRGRKEIATPIAELARRELNLPRVESADINVPEMVNLIADLEPELLLVIAFGQKIGPELLSLSGCRAVNIHASLLPKFRGAAPINWAIVRGETITGLTLFELNPQWDAGAIWGTVETPIGADETASELHDRLALLGPQLLEKSLPRLNDPQAGGQSQDASQATRAPKLKKIDGQVNWTRPAQEIHNQIRGFWSWPGAWTYLHQPGQKPLRITLARSTLWQADRSPSSPDKPGSIGPDGSVRCGNGHSVQILEVKPDNSKLMSFADFLNGRRIQPGDFFAADASS